MTQCGSGARRVLTAQYLADADPEPWGRRPPWATAVLTNFRQLSGSAEVKIHPIVARQVEAEVLAKLIATNNGAEAGARQELD